MPSSTVSIRLDAEQAFEEGMGAWDVQRNPAGPGLVLHDAVLVEDDGPGANGALGLSSRDAPPTVAVEGPVRARKILHVEDPRAAECWLLIRSAQWQGSGLAVELNDAPLTDGAEAGALPVPPGLLRKGDNVVVLSARDGGRATMAYAPRADILANAPERVGRPARSHLDPGGGAAWDEIDGEFNVRLHLRRYRPEGTIVSPVLDAGGGRTGEPSSRAEIRKVDLAWEGSAPEETWIELAFRSGPGPVADDASWTAWRSEGRGVPAGHRFVQWRARLASAHPLRTPVLRAVTLTAKVAVAGTPPWARTLRVAGFRNEDIRYTSIPFAYEDSRHPRLRALRRKHRLDDVVRGARTELEKLVALRDWVAGQWRWTPPAAAYPAWDADAILDGRTGFCVQFAVVYMQCALSLGFTARFVFGIHPGVSGGHEVCEVWSNEFEKWIFMDAADDIHHVDPATNTPLDMLEIHDRMLDVCYAGGAATPGTRPAAVPAAETIGTCYRLDLEPAAPPEDAPKLERRRPWAYWLLMHMMPRNNFHAQPGPLPKCQGFSWEWTGYRVWEDPRTPRGWHRHYEHFTGRRSDWQWTLNQVRFAAEVGEAPGAVRVLMGTVTPGFESFLVRVDGGDWAPSGAEFAWNLRPGANRLEMRVANHEGVAGPVSFLEVTLGS